MAGENAGASIERSRFPLSSSTSTLAIDQKRPSRSAASDATPTLLRSTHLAPLRIRNVLLHINHKRWATRRYTKEGYRRKESVALERPEERQPCVPRGASCASNCPRGHPRETTQQKVWDTRGALCALCARRDSGRGCGRRRAVGHGLGVGQCGQLHEVFLEASAVSRALLQVAQTLVLLDSLDQLGVLLEHL